MKVIVTWCVDKFRYYVVISIAIAFISGLIFSYSFVENALVSILITHISEEWGNLHLSLPKAAIIVNIQEGSSAVLQLFFSFVSDAYSGRFKMLVSSTFAYTIGLLLCWIAAWRGHIWIFYAALVLITLAKSAEDVILGAFLDDQLLARDRPASPEEEERAYSRSDFWWKTLSLLGYLAALFGTSNIDSFEVLSIISAISIGASLLWFLLGTKFYMRVKPTGSPLSNVLFVVHAAISKRNVEYPQEPEQLFENSSGLLQILPHVPWLRWLDKAALVPREQEKPSKNLRTVEEVKGVKYLFNMIPMWLTFLMFSLVATSGSTFFLEQANAIDSGFKILIFTKLDDFTGFMVDFVIDHFLFRRFGRFKKATLLRIGIGMTCCVFCCITAWRNAVHWLDVVERYPDEPKKHMNVWILTPQFFLLGVMKGLARDGLVNFFNSMVPESLRRYGDPFGEYVMGIGKFLSVALILICRNWFGKDISSSHLDRYYALLGVLSLVNAAIYWFVAHWYGNGEGFLVHHFHDQGLIDMEAGPLVSRSQSDRGHYMYNRPTTRVYNRKARSFSGPVLVPQPTKGSFRYETGDVNQETIPFSSNVGETIGEENFDDGDGCDKKASMDKDSDSSSLADRLQNESLSFPRLSNKGIHWRTLSMRSRRSMEP